MIRRNQQIAASLPEELREMFASLGEMEYRQEKLDRAVEKFKHFNPLERQVIVAYLQFKAAHDEYAREGIEAALNRYWNAIVRFILGQGAVRHHSHRYRAGELTRRF